MDAFDEWFPETLTLTDPQVLIALGVNLLMLLAFLAAYITIIRRAGYSGWWILSGLVPVVNLVMFFVFAFREWPVQRELRSARMVASMSRVSNRDSRFTWG